MELINLTYPHQLEKDTLKETVAAIGLFDGIHEGHQKVIQRAIEEAKKTHKQSAVITFHPNPAVVLSKGKKRADYLLPLEKKYAILEKMGVDRVYNITFNDELSQLSPQLFIDHFIKGLHIVHLVAGFDYSFGHKGAGNMKNIGNYCHDAFTYEVIDKYTDQDENVSSTRIRQLLDEGNIEEKTRLLTRPFTTIGQVIQGDQRGRTIGFPTANLSYDKELKLPSRGVYAVKVYMDDQSFTGITNLGYVPTFKTGELEFSLEVYILDFNQDIYGKTVEIEWLEKIRDEKKFDGIDALVAQLKADEIAVREKYLS